MASIIGHDEPEVFIPSFSVLAAIHMLESDSDHLRSARREIETDFWERSSRFQPVRWDDAVKVMDVALASAEEPGAQVAQVVEQLPVMGPMPWFIGLMPSYSAITDRLLGSAWKHMFPPLDIDYRMQGRTVRAVFTLPARLMFTERFITMGELMAAHMPRVFGLPSLEASFHGTGRLRELVIELPGESEERARIEALKRRQQLAMQYPERELVVRRADLDVTPDSVVDPASAWDEVAAGLWQFEDAFDHAGERFLVAVRRSGEEAVSAALSPREREVARWLARGESNKVIAWELGVTPSTVSTWIGRISVKLGISSRLELVAMLRLLEAGR